MHRTLSFLSFLPLLFVLLACLAQGTLAVPQTQPQTYKLRNVFPQLAWLRDTAIEKVFGLPPNSKATPSRPTSTSPTSNSQLPAKLLAKYGGDVVLRFNLSSHAEEKALAEAADTLFLDIWEFTNNWADIRLREADVRSRDLQRT